MGQFAVINIIDFSNPESVIQPVLTLAKETTAPTLSQINEMISERFQHEDYFATSTCDLMGHI